MTTHPITHQYAQRSSDEKEREKEREGRGLYVARAILYDYSGNTSIDFSEMQVTPQSDDSGGFFKVILVSRRAMISAPKLCVASDVCVTSAYVKRAREM